MGDSTVATAADDPDGADGSPPGPDHPPPASVRVTHQQMMAAPSGYNEHGQSVVSPDDVVERARLAEAARTAAAAQHRRGLPVSPVAADSDHIRKAVVRCPAPPTHVATTPSPMPTNCTSTPFYNTPRCSAPTLPLPGPSLFCPPA